MTHFTVNKCVQFHTKFLLISVKNCYCNSLSLSDQGLSINDVTFGGEGGVSQKFILQIFAIIKGSSVMNFREKNPQYDFPKMRRGVKSRLKLFQKFICFGIRSHLLILAVLHKEILYVLYFLDDIPHHDIISIFSLSEPFYKYISRYF